MFFNPKQITVKVDIETKEVEQRQLTEEIAGYL